MRRIAVIGGGAAGSALVARLLRDAASHGAPAFALHWFGGRRAPGRGVAYDTADPLHLLNVRAANMSLFADAPDDFLGYAQARGIAASDGQFLPRSIYGDYLDATLSSLRATSGREVDLVLHATEAVALRPRADRRFEVVARDHDAVVADEIVLAIGALPPAALPGVTPAALASGAYATDPWGPLTPLRTPGHVLVIGTGLSAVDALLGAAARWPRALLTAVSRRGRLPALHADHVLAPYAGREALLRDLGGDADPRRWLRRFRAATHDPTVDWRAVLDAVRAQTPRLWATLDETRRRRFLRHLRPLWEVARHRVPPQTAARIEALRAGGRLRVLAARVASIDGRGPLRVRLHPRGEARPHALAVDHAIQATGLEADARSTPHVLVRQLVDERLVRADALGLGLAAAADGRLLRAEGTPWPNLHALGTLLRGSLWECGAMPEIRTLAGEVAAGLLARAAQGAAATVR
ncbi:putative NAD(P)/FAD-binding protein YdhS [Dokdonella fugitiva]|uniref:Putative NAD(P)/FAD-binding protein YdhS n=1 Tax=Dokdonella fugitiva TaxID=328517 RepID=A0A839EXU3_9GAMM|nr:FAD/NAD(P)-binding protein [Dokdonella fugitiva]MBA8888585.1 putative NAD(P)/FAD-binding protein YdhS [Dokdonella fugitiva]